MPKFKVQISETMRWHGVIEAEDENDAVAKVEESMSETGGDAFHQDSMSEGLVLDDIEETNETVDTLLD